MRFDRHHQSHHAKQFLSSNTQDFIEVWSGSAPCAEANAFLSSNTQDFIEVGQQDMKPDSTEGIPEL